VVQTTRLPERSSGSIPKHAGYHLVSRIYRKSLNDYAMFFERAAEVLSYRGRIKQQTLQERRGPKLHAERHAACSGKSLLHDMHAWKR
jgi:hypothetical protein